MRRKKATIISMVAAAGFAGALWLVLAGRATMYRCGCELEVGFRIRARALEELAPEHVCNTETMIRRFGEWGTDGVVEDAVRKLRASRIDFARKGDSELRTLVKTVKFSIARGGRTAVVSAVARTPELAAQLANSYADAIYDYTGKANITRHEEAMRGINAHIDGLRSKWKAEEARVRGGQGEKDDALACEANTRVFMQAVDQAVRRRELMYRELAKEDVLVRFVRRAYAAEAQEVVANE